MERRTIHIPDVLADAEGDGGARLESDPGERSRGRADAAAERFAGLGHRAVRVQECRVTRAIGLGDLVEEVRERRRAAHARTTKRP